MIAFVLLLLSAVPADGVVREHVAQIEVNHYWDCTGDCPREIFTQYIFWENRGPYRVICDWRMSKGTLPIRSGDRWRLTFLDGETLRSVTADDCITTVTAHDPEVADRDRWPKEARRLLLTTP